MNSPLPRRVALVCPYSWSYPGGVQAHVRGLAGALREQGVEVEILAPADGPVDEEGFVPLGRSFPIRDNGSTQRVALSPLAILRTYRQVRRGGYDLVHLHEPMIPWVCLVALFASRAPVVGTFHMVGSGERWYRVFAVVARRAARRLAARITVSEAARDYVARSLPGEYRVVPNGIDTESFPALGTARRRSGPVRLLFIGRSEPRKGLPVLLEALTFLSADYALDLVGVAPEDVRGLRQLKAHGPTSEAKKRDLLQRSDVLVVPSTGSESFGVVVLEGMASALPVVASDLPGYREVLPAGAGRFFPVGDARALAKEIDELAADVARRRRMGAAGRKAAQRFDWHQVGREVLEVYRAAMTSRR